MLKTFASAVVCFWAGITCVQAAEDWSKANRLYISGNQLTRGTGSGDVAKLQNVLTIAQVSDVRASSYSAQLKDMRVDTRPKGLAENASDPLDSDLITGVLSQYGEGNLINLSISGANNSISISQAGDNNTTSAHILGQYNRALVSQTGAGNMAAFSQFGLRNTVSISQSTW